MLDINLIKRDPDYIKKALSKRQTDVNIDELLAVDSELRRMTAAIDEARAERNQAAKAHTDAAKSVGVSEGFKAQTVEIRTRIATLESARAVVQEKFDAMMASLPNILDERVPAGGKESNKVLRAWGEKPVLGDWALDHLNLAKKHKLVDYERGVKLSGSGFWIYTGQGAAMEWALLNYFCSMHYRDGYTFVLPPHLLLPASGFAAGQFPKFYEDVFHIRTFEGDRERFLLPTSETAILNIYRDEILEETQLPAKMFAYSPCYRSEAGGPRADERGTVRGHQFNKVEMFQFVVPDQAEQALNELVRRAETILEELGLHYRTVLLAAEDASASMALTYDVEVWLPSINAYKEVSSVSWASDYQARRAKIRYRPTGGKQTQLVHTLNASGLATSRLFPAILEQHQQQDGSVIVPEPLRAWLGIDRIGAS
jgi:seryl-tRNA synthetase